MKAITLLLATLMWVNTLGAQTANESSNGTFTSLNEALLNPPQVYTLTLVHQQLNTDTLDLSVFVNLQQLNLSNDSLFRLPKGLENLQKLTVLDISANNFTLLPEQLALIPNLQELYLNNEKYLDLEQSFNVINKITHLKRLHLDSIPNFKLPKQLAVNDSIEYLSMRYDGLHYIPAQLRRFRHLKSLDLEGNAIESVSSSILKNGELESLILSISPGFNFRKSFTVLAKEPRLKSFTISNSTVEFSEDFFILNNITSLSLRNNHLKTFPTSILTLKNLKNLDLSGNDFKSLPSTILALNSLETLDLTGDRYLNFNQTADLVRYLPSLRLIHIHDYDFTFSPQSYLEFKNSGNYIELFPNGKRSSEVHIFKSLKRASQPALNTPFNNFNAEGFGIRLGF